MPLQQSWVDHLFGRLSIRYGAAFLRQWPDTDPDLVKADWAEVLDGVRGDSISYALKYLPTEKPPNALQFRDICRRAPASDVPMIAAPDAKPDPARVKEIMARLQDKPELSLAEQCAQNIARIVAGRGMSTVQRQQLEALRRTSSSSESMGTFQPIDPAVLPPGMRA